LLVYRFRSKIGDYLAAGLPNVRFWPEAAIRGVEIHDY